MTAAMPSQIEHLPVEGLIPYARNARTHSPEQVAQIAASMREFGFTNPVLIDADGGLIAGHGRVMAARQLGLGSVPCIRLGHLSDAQKRAYVIADNKLALNAGWDESMLALELKDLQAMDYDLALTGFDLGEIDELLAGLEATPEGATDADAVPEVRAEAVTRLGDVWLLGRHRLMCGDSTDADSVARLMNGEKADMVFTDPPYALFGNSTGVGGITDDKMVRPFFRAVLSECKKQAKSYGHIYVCCDWHSAFSIESIAREIELTAKNLCVWDKVSPGLGNMYMNGYEFVWFFSNSPVQKTTMKRTSGERLVKGVSNIWRFQRVDPKEREHNAAKPVEMVCLPIEQSSDAGELVLDLFGGSGSTMMAAERIGRRAYLMEVEPKYCDVAVRRWQQFTGKQAFHAKTGAPFPG